MVFNRLPRLPEETEKANAHQISNKNESVKEVCNSKFYLPSTDINCNLIDDAENLKLQRTKAELANFLRTGDRIFCNECDSFLTTQSDPNQTNQTNSNKQGNQMNQRNKSSIDLMSICSLHNPPTCEQSELLTETAANLSQQSKSDRQM